MAKVVQILKQVMYLGQWMAPRPEGGPYLAVPDHTADHWIKTGAAKEADEKAVKAAAAQKAVAEKKAEEKPATPESTTPSKKG